MEIGQLVALAFASKQSLDTVLGAQLGGQALLDILNVGSSAGGARAKAVIAFNPVTGQVRSGQLDLPPEFEHWLIRFDGVKLSGDWGIADPVGHGLLEYSYYRKGQWDLSPAYDLCHAAGSDFTRFHQLSLNGKRTGFVRDNLKQLAAYAGLPRGRARTH